MDWFKNRIKERSTWLGLAALLGVFGIQIDDSTIEAISQCVIAGVGLIAVIMKE